MNIIVVILILLVFVVAFWAVNTYVTPGIIRTIINVVIALLLIFWLIGLAGLGSALNIRV